VSDPPLIAAVEAERIRRGGFKEFVRRAWPRIDTSTLEWNWHLDAIAEHLEALARREIRDLVINVPPGASKSLLVSVLFPSWMWTIDPEHRFIAASYAEDLSLRDARKHRTLVSSEWYGQRWGVSIPTSKDTSSAAGFFVNSKLGLRYSTTIRGPMIGQHCDTMIVDDPINPLDAAAVSEVGIDLVLEWWSKVAQTRFRNHQRSARVCVMQRVHHRDLSAELIRNGATLLKIPMRFRPSDPNRYAKDPRTQDGELMQPSRFPEPIVRRLEKALGATGASAQLQQDPTPPEGNLFKESHFKFWRVLPPGGTFRQSWDCKFKEIETKSKVVGQVWYQVGADHYLVDQVRGDFGFAETCKRIAELTARWPRSFTKLVEDKANGTAVVNVLRSQIAGLELIEPEGGKEARANAVQPIVESGNVYLPDPDGAEYSDGTRGAAWVRDEFLPEVIRFPKAGTDDQVDCMTQYLNHAAPGLSERMKEAMTGLTTPTDMLALLMGG
jgi:predicted phage terminase large subunit-like protein